MFPVYYLYNDFVLLILRVILGLVLVAHGWPKFKNLKGTAQSFEEGMGFKPGRLWATIAMIVEFFGGIALILGIFTQGVASLVLIQFLVIIIWKILKKSPIVGGLELDLLIWAIAVLLSVQGAGTISLDQLIFFGGF